MHFCPALPNCEQQKDGGGIGLAAEAQMLILVLFGIVILAEIFMPQILFVLPPVLRRHQIALLPP